MNFNSTFTYANWVQYTWYRFAMWDVITGLLCTSGFLGNILSFINFGIMKQHNASVVLFRALAIADPTFLLVVIIDNVPTACVAYMRYSSQLYDSFKTYTYLFYTIGLIVQCNTIWIAVLLAINRYIVICKPLEASRLCTVSNARKQVCFILGIILTIMSQRFFDCYIETHGDDKVIPLRPWAREGWYHTLGYVLYVLFFFLIPFGTIVILGIMIICEIRSTIKNGIRRHGQQNTHNSVNRLVFVIIIVFLICETPAMVLRIMHMILSYEPGRYEYAIYIDIYLLPISDVLCVLNSSINFPIYVVFNKTFRKTLCIRCKATWFLIWKLWTQYKQRVVCK